MSASTQLPGFLESLAPLLDHWGYAAVAFLLFVEDFGVPAPGETVLIAASVYAGAGRLNILAVAAIAFVAAILGDNTGYAIGRFGGRSLVLRYGRYILLTEERLEKAESFFNRHGGKIVTVARFIEGLRQANGIIAGITGMRWLKFLLFNALGAALWVATWTSVGYFAGNHIQTIYNAVGRYALYFAGAAVLLIVALVLRRRRRRAHAAAGGSGDVGDAGGSADAAAADDAGQRSGGANGADTHDANGMGGADPHEEPR